MNGHLQTAGTPPCTGTKLGILTACKIALRYRTTPSVSQLRNDFGMSRATAYRWVSAFKIARGEA